VTLILRISLITPVSAARSRISFNRRLNAAARTPPMSWHRGAAIISRPFPKDGEISSVRYSNSRPLIRMYSCQRAEALVTKQEGWYAVYNVLANCGRRAARTLFFRGWRSIDWKLFQRLPSEMYAGGKCRLRERERERERENGFKEENSKQLFGKFDRNLFL